MHSSIQPKNFSALKPGVQKIWPPRESGASSAGDQPVDVEQRHDVEAAIGIVKIRALVAMFCAEAVTLPCVSGTIFGREVVPEVCRISATSSVSP